MKVNNCRVHSSTFCRRIGVTAMKLRVRSLESRETLKLEVPNSCTLQQLKERLYQAIMSSSSSSLHLSLNRKEELDGSSPNTPIQSLGVTSGDLVFYSLDPNSFSPPILASTSSVPHQARGNDANDLNSQVPRSEEPEISAPVWSDEAIPEPKVGNLETPVGNFPNQKTLVGDLSSEENYEGKVSNSDAEREVGVTQELAGDEDMDVDGDSSVVMGKKFSEPCFLRRVLREELGDCGNDHRLLVIAVHAVMLETGFVGFDSALGLRVDRFHLPEEWSSTAPTISLRYTLPELLVDHTNLAETVVLKFQSLGQFVIVYGSLAKGGSAVHRVCLNKYRFAPTIDLVWAKNVSRYKTNENGKTSSSSYPETEVFEFWKIVKDGLALPLLIDICEGAGLLPPPCFMHLPTEIKLKILESLGGVDMAKVGCVCSELLYLSSSNDLWKQKFLEEFGSSVAMQEGVNWKETFASSWECKKKRKREARRWEGIPRLARPYYFPARRDRSPFGVPHFIGGDYDRLPGLGIPSPFGRSGLSFPRYRRNFSPNCNLGGFNG